MKLVVGIIRPERLEAVKQSLGSVEVFRLTAGDVQGLVADPDGGPPRLEPRVRLEIAVNEGFVEPTVGALLRAGRSDGGRAGDGHVLVFPLSDVVRIRTGERGPDAI
jgi:nitrogen regulatory protein P-II 1